MHVNVEQKYLAVKTQLAEVKGQLREQQRVTQEQGGAVKRLETELSLQRTERQRIE